MFLKVTIANYYLFEHCDCSYFILRHNNYIEKCVKMLKICSTKCLKIIISNQGLFNIMFDKYQ